MGFFGSDYALVTLLRKCSAEVAVFGIIPPCNKFSEAVLRPSSGMTCLVKDMYPMYCSFPAITTHFSTAT
jgi:hypothetical protein